MKAKVKIIGEVQRSHAIELLKAIPLDPIHKITIEEYKETRRLLQNDKMWCMLTDISEQVVWYSQKLTPAEWKDVFTAAMKKLKVVPGIDGGFVVIGGHTSKMTVAEMSEMIEFMYAFGAQHNVVWKERIYEE